MLRRYVKTHQVKESWGVDGTPTLITSYAVSCRRTERRRTGSAKVTTFAQLQRRPRRLRSTGALSNVFMIQVKSGTGIGRLPLISSPTAGTSLTYSYWPTGRVWHFIGILSLMLTVGLNVAALTTFVAALVDADDPGAIGKTVGSCAAILSIAAVALAK